MGIITRILFAFFLLSSSALCLSCGTTFHSLQEADCHIEKERKRTTDKPHFFTTGPSYRKNETIANAALRGFGLIEDGKPLRVPASKLNGPATMYGEQGAKGPFWEVSGNIMFKRDVALVRREAGKPEINLVNDAIKDVGKIPDSLSCMVEKIQIVPHWPASKYQSSDGYALVVSGATVRVLFCGMQEATTPCDEEAGKIYRDYLEKVMKKLRDSAEEAISLPSPFCSPETGV